MTNIRLPSRKPNLYRAQAQCFHVVESWNLTPAQQYILWVIKHKVPFKSKTVRMQAVAAVQTAWRNQALVLANRRYSYTYQYQEAPKLSIPDITCHFMIGRQHRPMTYWQALHRLLLEYGNLYTEVLFRTHYYPTFPIWRY